MEFAVNLLSGSTVQINKGFWTALSIKEEVGKRCYAQAGQLRLIYAGEELLDHSPALQDSKGDPVQLDCVRQNHSPALQDSKGNPVSVVSPSAQNTVLLSKELWLEHVETFCSGFAKCRALGCDHACLRFAPLDVRDDTDVVRAAAMRCPGAFKYASERLRSSFELVHELLPKVPEVADYIDSALHSYPEVSKVLARLWLPRVIASSDMEKWGELQVPSALKMNKTFVIEALESLGAGPPESGWNSCGRRRWRGGGEHPAGIGYIASYFHSDYDVVAALVKKNGLHLRYADGWLCDERDIVGAAVSQDGQALQFASNRLRADLEVVMMAASQGWRTLQFASDEMLVDQKVINAAMGSGLVAAPQSCSAWERNLYRQLCRRGLVLEVDTQELFDKTQAEEQSAKADLEEPPQSRRQMRQREAKRRQLGRERRCLRQG